MASFPSIKRRVRLFLMFLHPVLLAVSSAGGPEPSEVLKDLDSLRRSVSARGALSVSFDLDAEVCGLNPALDLVALRDATATVVVSMPGLPPDLGAGMGIKVRGRACWAKRGTHVIHLGNAPLLDIDGLHSPITQKAAVILERGDQPFRLEWFNGGASCTIRLEVEGGDLSRRSVPDDWYKRSDPQTGALTSGLDYQSYAGDDWRRIPDFPKLKPSGAGTVPALDPGVMPSRDNGGVLYTGFIRIPRSGEYLFHLTSDDGARVFLGTSGIACERIPPDRTPSSADRGVPAGGGGPCWDTCEGRVTFASWKDGVIELELADTENGTQATILDPGGLSTPDFLGNVVRLTGLKSTSSILVLGEDSVEIKPPPGNPEGVLKTASEVHRLSPEEAAPGRPVRLRGVVTAASATSFVLQDSSGGVFVNHISPSAAETPNPKEIWEVEGVTGAGDFSPVVMVRRVSFVRKAELPQWARPTREQFADGSLDAEQVEITGIVTSSTPARLELLTQEGTVFLIEDRHYPLPTRDWSAEQHAALAGGVVSLRGVYTAMWDGATRQVVPSRIRLRDTMLCITNPVPSDPFDAGSIKAADLLHFNAETRVFQRVKVAGTVLAATPSWLFVNDGTSGFRVATREGSVYQKGDRIEVVGFPRLEGSSPTLLEVRTRKIGAAALPGALVLKKGFLSNPRLDSTLVSIRGMVRGDVGMESSRTLELEHEDMAFLARIPVGSNSGAPYRKDSELELTGVYLRKTPNQASGPFGRFELQIGDAADIRVIRLGPWWTRERTLALIFTLCGLLALAMLGVTLLRREVVRRTGEIAVHIREREVIERHRVLAQERSRVAQDLHDELGAGLTEAGILAALANNPTLGQGAKSGYLHQLTGVCRTLVTDLDEIVWAVNPKYDAVADLAGYFSFYAQQFLSLAGIDCRLDIQETIAPHGLSSQARHGIFLAFKEALNNIVKHSRATVVHLTIETRKGLLVIVIADNGVGFHHDPGESAGEGLTGMEQRIRQQGGSFSLRSAPDEGTVITIQIPLGES